MILSVSRRTDIPAFYSKWFINRLREGFVYTVNPMNRKQISNIKLTPKDIECIVFWTKNPAKLIPYLDEIDKLGYHYYFQFTITSYGKNVECNVPKKEYIINIFKDLSNIIGSEKIIWRYDPIFISDKYTYEYHKKWFRYIAQQLKGFTQKCIISFIDMYKKCERNMRPLCPKNLSIEMEVNLAKTISLIARNYGIVVESCAEDIDLEHIGIKHGKCIDDQLISKILNTNLSGKKDKNQRDECGCIESVDIGQYNSCMHNCLYCYANFNKKKVKENFAIHNMHSPILIGNLRGDEKVTDRKNTKLKKSQLSLFNNHN